MKSKTRSGMSLILLSILIAIAIVSLGESDITPSVFLFLLGFMMLVLPVEIVEDEVSDKNSIIRVYNQIN